MPALITWWSQDVRALAKDCSEDAVYAAGAGLLSRWTEPHRHYHGTRHLVEMFWAIEELEDAAEVDAHAATIARIAAWVHDAVYDPTAVPGANESASALLARAVLADLGVSVCDVDTVEDLVLMTAGHDTHPTRRSAIEAAFHDADLWILSAPDARFDDYCTQVRAEYGHVPGAAYRIGRAAILRGFAARERIYRTDYAHTEWEPRARGNLHRELARLTAPDLEATR